MSSIDSTVAGVMAVKQAAMMSEIAYAVAGKTSDVVKQQGEAVVQLLEQAAQLGKAIGSGKNFDAVG